MGYMRRYQKKEAGVRGSEKERKLTKRKEILIGYSSFKYDITDISIPNDYWGSGSQPVEMAQQKASALWGEVVAGLQVHIYRGLSLGWSLRYKFRMHVSDGSSSQPWFLPGFGARNAPFSATFTVFYDI